jgi:glucose/mannose transport system permease protein
VRFRQDLVNTLFFTIFSWRAVWAGPAAGRPARSEYQGRRNFPHHLPVPDALSFIVTGTMWRWLFNPAAASTACPA